MKNDNQRQYQEQVYFNVDSPFKEMSWLEDASECWRWEEECSFAGIGSFSDHIKNLEKNGIFVLNVGLRSRQIRSRKINSIRDNVKKKTVYLLTLSK